LRLLRRRYLRSGVGRSGAAMRVLSRLEQTAVEAPVAVEMSVDKPKPVQNPEEPPATPPAAVIAMPEPFKPVNSHAKAVMNRRQGSGEQLRLF
jgi:hypothetical protein